MLLTFSSNSRMRAYMFRLIKCDDTIYRALAFGISPIFPILGMQRRGRDGATAHSLTAQGFASSLARGKVRPLATIPGYRWKADKLAYDTAILGKRLILL